MTGNSSATRNEPPERETGALEAVLETGSVEFLVPVIHDIEPAPVLAQATPKAVAVAGRADTAVPQTQSLDLAYEVLNYLTEPENPTPLMKGAASW